MKYSEGEGEVRTVKRSINSQPGFENHGKIDIFLKTCGAESLVDLDGSYDITVLSAIYSNIALRKAQGTQSVMYFEQDIVEKPVLKYL